VLDEFPGVYIMQTKYVDMISSEQPWNGPIPEMVNLSELKGKRLNDFVSSCTILDGNHRRQVSLHVWEKYKYV
jgi:hypothetical protein